MSLNFEPQKPIYLNYKKLKKEIIDAGYSLESIASKIERSEKWFYQAESANSMKVVDLCELCFILKKPIQFFFENNIETGNSEDLLEEREILMRMLMVNKQILAQVELLNK